MRSPLSVLDVVVSDLSILPEDKRVLLKSAVGRIKDIANNLLEKNRTIQSVTKSTEIPSSDKNSSAQLIGPLVEAILSEKRIQHRKKAGVGIHFIEPNHSYGVFANVQASEFKRVLSNLIDNSVDAIGDLGAISVRILPSADSWVEIKMTDTGKGISSDILPKLGQKGQTFGKSGGSGLGLYHARKTLEGWGGLLKITSDVGKGTEVSLRLPRVASPKWFVENLVFTPETTIVIVDDDNSIHRLWEGRLRELVDWVRECRGTGKVLYLVDYEFTGQKTDGLKLIEELGLSGQSVLVTSRYEEQRICDDCERLGVSLMPKGLAGFVPIII